MIILKLKIIDENNFILFIIEPKMTPNLKCEKELSDYLKKIFLKIQTKYELDIFGYYNVIIYFNDLYGMVIKLVKEDNEYLNYYSKQIEMKIVIADNHLLLYRINDFDGLNKKIILNSNIYLYKKNLYLELNECDFLTMGNLLEFSEIVFEDVEIIKKYGEKIEIR